jgi:NAD(P)-dependent dehydrogenase (short-subunit alcohol dehydrogenase family)
MKLDNQIAAVVTGGASGLGRASAEALAESGVKVTIFDVNEEGGKAVAEAIGGLFCKVDITSEDSVVAGYEAARAAHGQERVLVHCAQISKAGKTVRYDKTTGGILIASYRLASLSALGMANAEPLNDDGERGTIILTASAAAQDAQVGQVGYGSLKAGVNGLVLPMARDLMDLGIRVNSIMPGIFATPPMLAVKDRAPAIFDGLAASVPFPKRLGHPEEFGSLVLELVRNGYFNGQNLRLDGAIRMPPK